MPANMECSVEMQLFEFGGGAVALVDAKCKPIVHETPGGAATCNGLARLASLAGEKTRN